MGLTESLRDENLKDNEWVSWSATTQTYTGSIDDNGKKDGKGIFYEND
jgi:hypothetical protein